MKLNLPSSNYSYLSSEQQLVRTVCCCLLWEDTFYENGESVAARIATLVPQCSPVFVSTLAMAARDTYKLRHVPLLLVAHMARHPAHAKLVKTTLAHVIQRADELSEFVAIYAKVNGVSPKNVKKHLSAQVKKGLALAFPKFNEYALAKYNGKGPVKLRDVLFLCHAKPKDAEQDVLWKKLINDGLSSPGTWENRLSAGEDKFTVFTELMAEKQLGALAFLRNLRNMKEAGIKKAVIQEYAASLDVSKVLPFRFQAAARVVPEWEDVLEPLMLKACENRPKLKGLTAILVDVSGSMAAMISGKSDISRIDAASGVAILLREICDDVAVFSFSNHTVAVPPRHGFALRDAIDKSQTHSSTRLRQAVKDVNAAVPYDRLVIITDEQSTDGDCDAPKGKGYIINVATSSKGVGYGKYTHISGWSEGVIDFIQAIEE